MCIERKSENDTSLLMKAKHYGNHQQSLFYGGFLDSTYTYDKESSTSDPKLSEDCRDVCKQPTCSDVCEVEKGRCFDALKW